MKTKIKKLAINFILFGIAISVFLLVMIFRPIPGEEVDAVTDYFSIHQKNDSTWSKALVSIRDTAETKKRVTDISFDMSNITMNPSRFTQDEITSWKNVLEIANYYFDEKFVKYRNNGMYVVAKAITETGPHSTGRTPITVAPDYVYENFKTLDKVMLGTYGIQDWVVDGNSNIPGLNAGTIGILQQAPGYVRVVDSEKVSGEEYSKLEESGKLDIAGRLGTGNSTLLLNVTTRLKYASRVDRFNWSDACNIAARTFKDANDIAAGKGFVDATTYQTTLIAAQYHNQPAVINTMESVTTASPYGASVRGFTNSSQYVEIYNQFGDDTLVLNLKKILSERYSADAGRKVVFKSSDSAIVSDWKAAGFLQPEGLNTSYSNWSYCIRVLYQQVQLELLYSGV